MRAAPRDVRASDGMRPIGVFGGTFDPIHYGHLRSAFELGQRLALAQVRFVPNADPPHRERPATGAALRLEMVRAAIATEPSFVVDDRELARAGPSYTVDTLASLREDFPDRPLCLLLGMDAFLGLPTWSRWRQVLELAHVIVAHRPGAREPVDGETGALLKERRAASVGELATTLAGLVHVEPVTQLEISSSELRRSIRRGGDPRFLVPDAVREIIMETRCYAETSE